MNIEELRSYLKSLSTFSDKEKNDRIEKSFNSFRYFITTYFSHYLMKQEDKSKFRNFIYDNIVNLTEKHDKLMFLSYRGSGKTTLITRLFTLYQAVIHKANYIVIISNTLDVAQNSLEFIKAELEENANLISDFEITKADMWQADEIVIKVKNKFIKFKAFGSGRKIRGENFRSNRPDLIVLDDIENDENVVSEQQRNKLEKWFTKAIMFLVDMKKKSNIIVVGTLLHHDSVLKRISNRKDFKTFTFKLVETFGDINLFEELYMMNREMAYKRFLEHKKLYTKGFKIDDENLNLFEIMMTYFEDKDAFFSEFQNEPLVTNSSLSDFKTYNDLPNDLIFALAVDPAISKDYSAIVILGKSNKEKKFYVVYAKGFKIKLNQLIKKIIELNEIYKPRFVIIETVAFQEFFKDKLKEEALERNIYLPIVCYNNRTNKKIRILSLSPYLSDSTILINKNEHMLITELLTFPHGHDDILDALEMCFRQLSNMFDYKLFRNTLKHKYKNNIGVKFL